MNNHLGKVANFLIISGACSLIGLAFLGFMVIKDPEGFQLSRIILSSLEVSEPILSGRIGDKVFVLDAAKPVRYIFFGFVGIFLISMMVSISNGMLTGGIKLAKYVAESNQSIGGGSTDP